jgi:hypothetical protein
MGPSCGHLSFVAGAREALTTASRAGTGVKTPEKCCNLQVPGKSPGKRGRIIHEAHSLRPAVSRRARRDEMDREDHFSWRMARVLA